MQMHDAQAVKVAASAENLSMQEEVEATAAKLEQSCFAVS